MLALALLFGLAAPQDAPLPSTAPPDMAAAGEPSVTVECILRPNGRMTDCRVMEENPAGAGYGEAALNAARETRVAPRRGGGPAGVRLRWTTRFTPLEDSAPVSPAPSNP